MAPSSARLVPKPEFEFLPLGRVGARIAPDNREAKDRCDREKTRATTAPPRRAAGASRCWTGMRRVDGAKNNNLTFDLSGWPKASPLEGRVRPQQQHGCDAGQAPL